MIITENDITRFEAKYIPEPNSGCWLWIGALFKHNYGHFTLTKSPGKTLHIGAHKFSYLLYKKNYELSLDLDHLCRNSYCVNPEHLEPVTHRVNQLRGNTIMAQLAKRTHCFNGHEYIAANTRLYKNNRVCKECERIAARRQYHRNKNK